MADRGTCLLHVPHKLWANRPEELNAYVAIERWSLDTITSPLPLHIPHKDVPGDRNKFENYLAVERWATALITGVPYELHIPFKNWAASDQERDNWTAIERWAASYPACLGGKVWAITEFAFGDEWWTGDGKQTSGAIIFPPDNDAWNQGIVAAGPAWYAGGSDGTFIYQLAIDSTGQWWVDKFNSTCTALLDRWQITGWITTYPPPSYDPFLETQHVSCGGGFVVVIANKIDASLNQYSIETTVFDLNGNILNQWVHLTPDFSFINTQSGSYTDGSFVYFWIDDQTAGDQGMCKIELATGTFTELFLKGVVDAQSPPVSPFGTGSIAGLVLKDGDIIFAGSEGVTRCDQTGTVIWFADIRTVAASYRALAHSGKKSVWLGYDSISDVDEFDYDGNFKQTITVPEVAIQAWLVGTP